MNAIREWLRMWAIDIVLISFMVVTASYVLSYNYQPQETTIYRTQPVQYTVPETNGIMYFTKAE